MHVSFHLAFSGCVPRSAIAGLCGSSVFSFLRDFHTFSWAFQVTQFKESACQCRRHTGPTPGSGEPLEEGMATTPVFLSGEWHAQRRLRGHSPRAHRPHRHTHFHGSKHIHVVVWLLPRVLTPGLSVKLKLCPHSTLRPCAVPPTSPGPLFSFLTL